MIMEMVYFAAGRYADHDAKPTLAQRRIEHRAVFIAGVLRTLMAKLTVPQQMALLETIRGWGVFVRVRPASDISTVAAPKSHCRASVAPPEPRQFGGGNARPMQPLQ